MMRRCIVQADRIEGADLLHLVHPIDAAILPATFRIAQFDCLFLGA
jgi:hypothetical protein